MASPQDIVDQLGCDAKAASRILSQTTTAQINDALEAMANALRANTETILDANQKDVAKAEQRGLSDALIDRLRLTPERIEAMAHGLETVRDLPDPVGKILSSTTRPNGLKIDKISVPIGVLGMIYESRPNVTIDASALCLKARNAVILRGGSESLHSSLALHKLIQQALEAQNLPKAAVSMIPIPDREAVGAMLRAADTIDVMIPRGGKGLIERVMNEARMPVFGHLEGLCHIYIDASVDPKIAREVTLNAKMRRTGICGAAETLLLDKSLAPEIEKDVLDTLEAAGCEIITEDKATEEDWRTEYLAAKISVKHVEGVQGAIDHIAKYGSHHTDSILAEDPEAVTAFQACVDSGIVMHNTSTQFADGGEFGMGAEIGIATGKMHARGPVGLEQLCSYKYLVHGSGQTRP